MSAPVSRGTGLRLLLPIIRALLRVTTLAVTTNYPGVNPVHAVVVAHTGSRYLQEFDVCYLRLFNVRRLVWYRRVLLRYYG